MKNFFKKHGKLLIILASVLVFCAAVAAGVYFYWYYSLPRFQNVTIELGQPLPEISQFMTELAKPEKASFVTKEEELDLTQAGQVDITLRHGRRDETVKLTIHDTTPPELTLQNLVRAIDYVPAAQDFIVSSFDLSETTADFVTPIPAPENYGDVTVEIIITDTSKNSTTATATLSYVWMLDTFTMELGSTLEKADLLMDAEKDGDLLDQEQLDAVNEGGVGEYTITSTDQGQTCSCTVTVADTTPPTLVLQDVSRDKGGRTPSAESFVDSCEDLSGDVTLTLLTQPDTQTPGTQVMQIEAKDIYGNTTVAEANLYILTDTTPPSFSGVGNMTVEKHSTPDYESGVSANDKKDGSVPFTYDASSVNTEKAGTYYVTYSAKDSSGNRGTYRRKVTVNHDYDDTLALIAAAAESCGSDAESIRNYLRNHISYSSSWGGNDPVYNGLTTKRGNCYVQASCLKALLNYRGYSCQLIWTTDKSHYWVIVDMGGYWRHIDSTPGSRHSKYSLMNDTQRFETLQSGFPDGRDWDRESWPAAN